MSMKKKIQQNNFVAANLPQQYVPVGHEALSIEEALAKAKRDPSFFRKQRPDTSYVKSKGTKLVLGASK